MKTVKSGKIQTNVTQMLTNILTNKKMYNHIVHHFTFLESFLSCILVKIPASSEHGFVLSYEKVEAYF